VSRYTSRIGAAKRLTERAIDAGLVAAAQVVVNRVKTDLRGGYRSGDFVTGLNTASVIKTEPFSRAGARTILVGTSITDPGYPLFWELGHVSAFTRRFERKEVWRPALMDTKEQQYRAFVRVSARVMAGGGFAPASEAAD
jgi:hypothetical protein